MSNTKRKYTGKINFDTPKNVTAGPMSNVALLAKYLEATNPVTKWSLRGCIEERIARGEF